MRKILFILPMLFIFACNQAQAVEWHRALKSLYPEAVINEDYVLQQDKESEGVYIAEWNEELGDIPTRDELIAEDVKLVKPPKDEAKVEKVRIKVDKKLWLGIDDAVVVETLDEMEERIAEESVNWSNNFV